MLHLYTTALAHDSHAYKNTFILHKKFHIHCVSPSLLCSLDLFRQFGDSREQVGNETCICDLEDGCIGVLHRSTHKAGNQHRSIYQDAISGEKQACYSPC
jgi:hypothetical protein